MSREVRIATGNPTKVALLGGHLAAAGFSFRMADPGDAEERAVVGYRSAVEAKLAGVPLTGPPVVAHDSGFEFECLDGAPGPRTKAWMAATDDARRVLVAGTRVRVVHCVGLRQGDQTTTFLDHDDRFVPEHFRLQDSGLPLTDCFTGPRESLARLMALITARLSGPTGAGE